MITDELLELAKRIASDIEGRSRLTQVRRIKKGLWRARHLGIEWERAERGLRLSNLPERLDALERRVERLELARERNTGTQENNQGGKRLE